MSNIRIVTAALGVTANEVLSVDLVYHHYRQIAVEAGDSSHLGDGIDLVLGLRPNDALEIDAAIGWFASGENASVPDRSMAARIEVEYAF